MHRYCLADIFNAIMRALLSMMAEYGDNKASSDDKAVSIFRRWRQLGRRYFWPHLLLGMVAASVGLPGWLNDVQASTLLSPVEHKPGNVSEAARLIRHNALQAAKGYAWYGADGRQAGAVFSGVVRHWSFSLAPQILALNQPSLSLADLSFAVPPHPALTTRKRLPLVLIAPAFFPSVPCFSPADWLSQVCGIRAGPAGAVSLYG